MHKEVIVDYSKVTAHHSSLRTEWEEDRLEIPHLGSQCQLRCLEFCILHVIFITSGIQGRRQVMPMHEENIP
jgi:hypothetical protein